jgi:hypothetical protein
MPEIKSNHRFDWHRASKRFCVIEESLMRDVQFHMRDHFVAAMVGRFDLPDGQSQSDALTSAEYLRRDIALARDITRDFAGISSRTRRSTTEFKRAPTQKPIFHKI